MTSLLTSDRIQSLVMHADSVKDIPGCFAELGVYEGGMTEILARGFPNRKIFACDTFEGLPSEHFDKNIEYHQPGEFRPSDSQDVIAKLQSIPNVSVVKGLFPGSAGSMEGARFAFVHLDFDFYVATKEAIQWLLPRMNVGGIIAFDDYEWKHTAGVKKAIEETIGLNNIQVSRGTTNSDLKQAYYTHK